ncbi:MAG: glycosyltransferase family 4 protein [Chloroflexi bacterium]|nr:glycosyltransferase family 4 protein [Chloroflexota bacterium]
MKRVLFVDHVNRILGGAEINLLELLHAAAAAQNWTVACACVQDSLLSRRLAELRIPQWNYGLDPALSTFRLVGKRLSFLKTVKTLLALREGRQKLAAVIAQFHPEAVVTCTNKDHFCAAALGRRWPLPLVWWVNDIVSPDFFTWPVRLAFRRQALKSAARIVTVSEYARRALLQEGLPERLITTIHNGLPLEQYRRSEPGFLRRQLGLPPDQPLAGLVGRYAPWKGQDFFLRLALAWIRQNQTGHFVLIGHAFNEDQAYEAALRRFVSEHALSARVHFLPFQQNMAAVLSDLNLLVHASVLPEPFGRVIIEAMAAGTPVLAARSGGVPEIITHEVTGRLAEPGHLESYLAQLQKALLSGPDSARLAEAAQRLVQERFNLEQVRQKFEKVIDEASDRGTRYALCPCAIQMR